MITIEELNLELDAAQEMMEHAIEHLEKELSNVRAGRVSPSMLNGVLVPYYGSDTPVQQVANIGVVDGRTLSIQPWEKNMLNPIEKALFAANLGVTPQNDGNIIRISVPVLTEERRRQLAKQSKEIGEHAKISVRKARQEAKEGIHKMVKGGLPEDMGKDGEARLQKLTDKFIDKIEHLIGLKEKEIMSV